jgi:hypothetical protein
MELFVLALGLFSLLVYTGGTLFVGFVAGLVYGALYYDKSERTGERAWSWLRAAFPLWRVLRWLTGHRVLYYPGNMLGTQTLFAAHPHGMLALSALFTFLAAPAERHVLLGVHAWLMAIPGVRDVLLALGAVDASKHVLLPLPRVALVIDGVRGMGPTDKDEHRPRGFLRLVLEQKRTLVPVFFGGEAQLFWTPKWLPPPIVWLRAWTTKWLRVPLPTPFMLRFWDMPTLLTVYGTPLQPEEGETLDCFERRYWDEMDRLKRVYYTATKNTNFIHCGMCLFLRSWLPR